MSGIGPISDRGAWRLANPDDDGQRECEFLNAADERFYDLSDIYYQRWKEGDYGEE